MWELSEGMLLYSIVDLETCSVVIVWELSEGMLFQLVNSWIFRLQNKLGEILLILNSQFVSLTIPKKLTVYQTLLKEW